MKKDKNILLRVSADEKRKLSRLAKNSGISVSKYLLDKAFGTSKVSPPPDEPPAKLSNETIQGILKHAWRRGNYGFF
jgi:hypothetical protein